MAYSKFGAFLWARYWPIGECYPLPSREIKRSPRATSCEVFLAFRESRVLRRLLGSYGAVVQSAEQRAAMRDDGGSIPSRSTLSGDAGTLCATPPPLEAAPWQPFGGAFALRCEARCLYGNSMSLPSLTLALLTSLLIVGCATNEQQSSPPQIQTWHRDDISTHGAKKKNVQ